MAQFPTAVVTAYSGGKWDANNIPANPSILAATTTQTQLDVINCLPFYDQQVVTICVKRWGTIYTTNFMKIHFNGDNFDYYGIVVPGGRKSVAMDRVEVTLRIVNWLTAGGTSTLTSVSGYVKRHTVADDTFGKYCQEDPLISPAKPLELAHGDRLFNSINFWGGKVICEATIDLDELGDSNYKESITFDTDGTVTTPVAPPLHQSGSVYQPTQVEFTSPTGTVTAANNPVVAYFDGDDTKIQAGIAKARSLGIDNGILNQYIVPTGFGDCIATGNKYTTMKGKCVEETPTSSDLDYEYATVMNKRVLYGSANKYTLVSMATGNKLEANPEELIDGTDTKPTVFAIADVRGNGCPMFRFKSMNHDTDNWMSSCINGLEWQKAPINYRESSGAGVQGTIFSDTQEMHKAQYEIGKMERKANAVQNALSNPLSALGVGFGAAKDIVYDTQFRDQMFMGQQALEKARFQVDTQLVAPQINFPRSEQLRDMIGNGVLLYRTKYSATDLTRIDRILNMFGYADQGCPAELVDFTCGKYYNYIEADVKLTFNSNVPQTIIEGAQQEVSGGIRIWKCNPDDSLYNVSNRN